MVLLKSQLENVRQILNDIKAHFDTILHDAPPGTLTWQKKGKYEQFMHMYVAHGKRIRLGITRNEEVKRQLAQKEFARKAGAIVDHNLKTMDKAIEELKPFEPEDLLRSMPTAYSKLPEDYFFNREHLVTSLHLSGEDLARILRHREWGKADYRVSNYKPEWKKHRTSRGLKMRSKSEVLIMEKLYHYAIDVRYEQEHVFGNEIIAPDFTFEAADGKLFCWEHLGMMDVPDYAAKNYRKLMKYYDFGLILGKNLIVSSDLYGTIDMKLIDFIIQNEVLPRL